MTNELTQLTADIEDLYAQLAAMARDRERTQAKVESLRAEMQWTGDPANAQQLAGAVLMLHYTDQQYAAQMERLTQRLLELRARLPRVYLQRNLNGCLSG